MSRTGLLLLAAVILVGTSEGGKAADLDRGETNYSSYPALWQGSYVGIIAGVTSVGVEGSGRSDTFDLDRIGPSGGELTGYNIRNGPWVIGVEGDLNGAFVEEKKNIAGLGDLKVSSYGYSTLRLRGGYSWDNLLVYGTAGIAATYYQIESSLGGHKERFLLVAPVLGVGAEYAFDTDWAFRVEALAVSRGVVEVKAAGEKHELDLVNTTLRVGLIHQF